MLPPSRYSRRTRRDRLSISVVPEQSLEVEPRSPYLHWLFGESNENDIHSRLVDDERSEAVDNATSSSKADAVIMKEVAAWLELREHDEFWVSRRKRAGKILPTAYQLLGRLKELDSPPPDYHSGTEGFDALIQAIALQLLASCYTFLPASSANHIPLFHQRTGTKRVTALRAHSPYQLSPAAGHHARPPSETSAWPGLYTGPSLEDAVADTTSRRRRSAKRNSEYIPYFAASGWTDGPDDADQQRHDSTSCRRSRCLSEPGIFTRLICQPPTPRNPHRKHNSLFSRGLCGKKKEHSPQSNEHPRKEPDHKIATQSMECMQEEGNPGDPTIEANPQLVRRTSSDPSIGSRYDCTTPNASHRIQHSSTSMKACGTDNIISAYGYLDKTRTKGPQSPYNQVDKPPLHSSAVGTSPPTEPEEKSDQESGAGYFNLPNPALLQPDNEREPYSNPDSHLQSNTAQPQPTPPLDTNGQNATDRQNDYTYGTETGHDTSKPHTVRSALLAAPGKETRIHDRLASDDDGMYAENGPDPASDPRLMKLLAHREDEDGDSSGSEVGREKRRMSLENEEGRLDSEIAERVLPMVGEGGGLEESWRGGV